MEAHRSGPNKQHNKKHKSKFSSKGETKRKGRQGNFDFAPHVSFKDTSSKLDKKNRLKQIAKQKIDSIVSSKKYSTPEGAPKIVVSFSISHCVSITYSKQPYFQGVVYLGEVENEENVCNLLRDHCGFTGDVNGPSTMK
jgi:hypothetical protein